MLRILGRKTSNNVQKVLWLLAELDVPHQQEDYGGPYGKTQTPEYLALNPNGTVPTLVDGDIVLWESNAVVRYLANKYQSALYPQDLHRRALVEQWMDWQVATLSPTFRPLFIGLVREKRSLDDLQAARTASDRLFRLLDAQLARHGFIAMPALTLADLAIAPMVYRWYTLRLASDDTPHLRAYFARMSAMPAFKKVVMIDLA